MVVQLEVRGRVAVVTLNRPEARNAVSPEVTAAMTEVLDAVEADDDVWAVVLTGAGRAFCAGADLRAAAEGRIREIAHPQHGFAGIVQRDIGKPLIAAVNGPALAGGFEVVLACDLVVAAEHAVFGIPEVKRGLMAVAGGLIRLPRRVPLPLAMELALTGDTITAARARELGLLNRVVPGDRVLDEALELAAHVCENAPLAVRGSRALLRLAAAVPEAEAWSRQWELARPALTSPDALEGARAFVEKRRPNWTGAPA